MNENYIPKRIIYCGFGGKEKPQIVKNCMASGKKYMPDGEILEINENNFDVNINQYCKDAYDAKKGAYVSDVARLGALKEYGGVYMDTDVEVFKPLDKFLKHRCFTGFESINYPIAAILGAEPNNKIINELLDLYQKEKFETHENWGEYRTNTVILSEHLRKYIKCTNEYQENEIAVYPSIIFTSNPAHDGQEYAQHHMAGSGGEGE